MRRNLFALLVVALSLATTRARARADEGMWTFTSIPKERIEAQYNVALPDAFLDRLRLATARFGMGGSGSFVSAHGLVLTNQHVGAECVHALGAKDRDYIADGFLATRASDEIRCPGLELVVTEHIESVTAAVRSVEQLTMDQTELLRARKRKMNEIEKTCSANANREDVRCEVVSLYAGAVFDLYRYRRYHDVRLVFAPEFQIAFFGGDPDNFEYPRFALDVALFRAYDNDRPVQPASWLPMSTVGAQDGDVLFSAGFPWMTERLYTVAQLELLRDLIYPDVIADLERIQTALIEYAQRSVEDERQAHQMRFQIDNSLKMLRGELLGLRDKALFGAKQQSEQAFRAKLDATPELVKTYAGVWDRLRATQQTYRSIAVQLATLEGRQGSPFNSELYWIAKMIVRFANEAQKPSGERLRNFRDANLASLEAGLFSTAPIHAPLEEAMMRIGFERMIKLLGADEPHVKAALGGQSPAARAAELIRGSTLASVEERRKLWNNPQRVAESRDPLIVLARQLEPEARRLRQRWEDEIEAPMQKDTALISRARFAVGGTTQYPDATNTLRFGVGRVLGYQTSDGKTVASSTTFGGLFARADEAGGKLPWALPPRWLAARKTLTPSTQLDFISTNDIVGGSSGSPLVNAAGELVGIVFDGNLENLANSFAYSDTRARSINVHSVAVLDALANVYHATALVDELRARTTAKPSPPPRRSRRRNVR